MAQYDFPLGAQLPLDRCPHCGVAKPLLEQLNGWNTQPSDDDFTTLWAAYKCSTCGSIIMASQPQNTAHVKEVFPSAPTPDSALPSDAQHYLKQAYESLSAPSGAVMLAASAVDAMLKEKGYKEGSLYSRIDKAAEENVITDEMAAWAHNVRLDANDERHADEDAGMPDREDAKRCVNFAEALGEFLFVLPARVERGRKEAAEDEERKAAAAAPDA